MTMKKKMIRLGLCIGGYKESYCLLLASLVCGCLDLVLLGSSDLVQSSLEFLLGLSCFLFLVSTAISDHLVVLSVLLPGLEVFIDTAETGSLATTELGLESIDDDTVLILFVGLSELLSDRLSGWISCVWMSNFDGL